MQDAEKDTIEKDALRKSDVEALKKLEGEIAANSAHLVSLLQDANKYIEDAAEIGNCPVCEQSIDSTQLLDLSIKLCH